MFESNKKKTSAKRNIFYWSVKVIVCTDLLPKGNLFVKEIQTLCFVFIGAI